jgi:pimeloyl-ACP methyl ester carboxylesterase
MDAMRPHIAAHSWGTLAFVALFFIVHLSDYLTVGRLVNRLDALVLANADAILPSLAMPDGRQQDATIYLPRFSYFRSFAPALASRLDWRKFLPIGQPQLALNLDQPTAKLYTFTAVTTTAAQVSGSPYPVTHQHFIVEPD